MDVIAIRAATTPAESLLIRDMHRLRARVFRQRLGWNVTCRDGCEEDEFDELRPTYILVVDGSLGVIGSVRLLPATGPTMLERVFSQLLAARMLKSHDAMIESSRFCVDTAALSGERDTIHVATFTLLAGIVEWCLDNGYSELVTATDLRMERLLKRCRWPMDRLGDPCRINETMSVAGLLPVDLETLISLRPAGYRSRLRQRRKEAA